MALMAVRGVFVEGKQLCSTGNGRFTPRGNKAMMEVTYMRAKEFQRCQKKGAHAAVPDSAVNEKRQLVENCRQGGAHVFQEGLVPRILCTCKHGLLPDKDAQLIGYVIE